MEKLTFSDLLVLICVIFAGFGAALGSDSWGWFLVIAALAFSV